MFSNTKLSRNCAKWLLLVVLFTSCEKQEVKKDPNYGLLLNKHYLFSFNWTEKNPFEKTEIDTVKIIGLKNGYVQWQYRNGIKQSSEVRIFRRLLVHNQ